MAAHFHSVPGRLRVHVPRVKGNIASARAVEASLSKLIGVSRVESRELTGSVVVHYDPKTTDHSVLLAAMGVAPHSVAVFKPALSAGPRLPAKVGRKVAEAVVWHLLEAAAERAVPLLIAAIL